MELENTVDTSDTAARLRRSITRMNRRLRHNALGGVSPAQASMLASIEKLERPSLGDLATLEQIQPPSVTRLVRTLEDGGFVSTSVDENDRRCTRVVLTAAGRREVTAIRQRKTEFLESRLRELDPRDQRRAAELADLLEHLLGES
jgi:DNA-binding MarR family transcriptional regulator